MMPFYGLICVDGKGKRFARCKGPINPDPSAAALRARTTASENSSPKPLGASMPRPNRKTTLTSR